MKAICLVAMIWKQLVQLGICFSVLSGFGQGMSKTDSSEADLLSGIDIGFGSYYQFTSFGNTEFSSFNSAGLPRRPGNQTVINNWSLSNDLVTDVPFFHGTYFFRLGYQYQFDSALTVSVAANFEQRGFSDGVFSQNTLNVYPYLNVRYFKQISDFSILLQLGDFWDMRLYEGLTFYNLETQSWILKAKYKKFYFKHVGVGDLLIGIGLRIDDLYDYSMGFEKVFLDREGTRWLDLRAGYSNNRGSVVESNFVNLSAAMTTIKGLKSYAQLSRRQSGASAFLIGMEKQFATQTKKIEGHIRIAYRNYSRGFNSSFSNTVYYRDPQESSAFTNNRFNVFIPIEYYERDFSQWAVYTEVQEFNVSGFESQLTLDYNVTPSTFFRVDLENTILSYSNEQFFLPFYQVAVGQKLGSEVEFMLAINNKVINYDKNYPTFYSADAPYLLLKIYKRLGFLDVNDARHRR